MLSQLVVPQRSHSAARILPDARFYMISENTAYLLSHRW